MNATIWVPSAAGVRFRCAALSIFVASWFFFADATAALVGPAGYINAFTAQPAAADWATLSRSGAPSDIYDSDTDVNANVTAAAITRTTADAGNPPATMTVAMWSSTGLYLQTRPKTIRYIALMGKFVNDTGTNATQIRFSYLYTIAAGGTAEDSGKGTRVYYSLTGLANSWVNLPALNHVPSANMSSIRNATLALNWTNGAPLYLLWVDDNSNNIGDDAANQFDDFSLQVIAGVSANLPPTVSLTAPARAIRVAPGTNLTLTASASDPDGTVAGVEFYDGSIFSGVEFIGEATNAPFRTVWSNVPAGIHTIFADAVDDRDSFSLTAPVVVEAVSSNANVILFPDFLNATNLILQGSAVVTSNRLRLTPAAINQAGGVWLDSKQTVEFGFEAVFQFQISPGSNGADGIAFVIQNNNSPLLGDAGVGLGYNSIANSLAVEFDTFQNAEAGDPDGNHISVHSGGTAANSSDESASLGNATLFNDISDGAIHTVVIRYGAELMRVFLDDLELPPLELPVNLGTLLNLDNGAAWVGLTAATSAGFENHDIIMWSFRPNVPPQVQLPLPGNGPFITPTNLVLSANAFDSDGEITNVEFYADEISIGTAGSAPFQISWTNPPAGMHSLTAQATDDFGAIATSLPVALTLWEAPRLHPTRESDGSITLAFITTIGKTYTVQYTVDLVNWTNAVPSLNGTGALVQWHDTGPPVTESLPVSQPQRFYRVKISQ